MVKRIAEFIKINQDKIFLSICIIAIGLFGFGLGWLSSSAGRPELKIDSTLINVTDLKKIVTGQEKNNTVGTVGAPTVTGSVPDQLPAGREVVSQRIVGNKTSKIYHYENCPGALKMKEENKIYFGSAGGARSAGYKPAGNCPGLK